MNLLVCKRVFIGIGPWMTPETVKDLAVESCTPSSFIPLARLDLAKSPRTGRIIPQINICLCSVRNPSPRLAFWFFLICLASLLNCYSSVRGLLSGDRWVSNAILLDANHTPCLEHRSSKADSSYCISSAGEEIDNIATSCTSGKER